MKNKAVLKLNTKPYSGFGIASFALAMVVLTLSIIAILMSAFIESPSYFQEVTIGVLAWSSALLTITGLGLAILGEYTKEREQVFSHIGLALHIVGLFYNGAIIWFGYFS